MVLVCHLISQDHVIKGSSDFKGKSPSYGGPYGIVLVCHVITVDHVPKCDNSGENPSL